MRRDEWMSNKKFPGVGIGAAGLGCILSPFLPFVGLPLLGLGLLWNIVEGIRSLFIAAPEFAKVACPACGRPEELTLDTATWVCKECRVRSRFDAATRAAMPLGQFAEPPPPTPPGPPTP